MNERLSADTGVHAGNAFDLTPDQKLILDEADRQKKGGAA